MPLAIDYDARLRDVIASLPAPSTVTGDIAKADYSLAVAYDLLTPIFTARLTSEERQAEVDKAMAAIARQEPR